MHACIAAVSQAVPTVALAYSDKFIGVMKAAGVSVPVADLRRESAMGVCNAIQKAFNNRGDLKADLNGQMSQVRNRIAIEFSSDDLKRWVVNL